MTVMALLLVGILAYGRIKARSHGSGLNAHSIRFASFHVNPLLLDANSMRIAFNPPPEVDWKRIAFIAWADVSKYKALGGLNAL